MRAQLEAEDHQSRVLYELCSFIIQVLKLPSLPFPFLTPYPDSAASPSPSPSSSSSSSSLSSLKRQLWWATLTWPQDSPVAFASLFLGISLALMLFGFIIFIVGFLLLPWVTLLVLVFYVAALVSNLSELGRSFLDPPRCTRMSYS